MKNLILSFLCLIPVLVFAQIEIDSIEDKRDGRIYETIKIDGTRWFRDNLKYETVSSYCPNFQRKESDCQSGNFYSYQELAEVCPEGWRIPNEREWKQFGSK